MYLTSLCLPARSIFPSVVVGSGSTFLATSIVQNTRTSLPRAYSTMTRTTITLSSYQECNYLQDKEVMVMVILQHLYSR